MRALLAQEVDQVAGAQNTWVFMGEPVTVADIQALQEGFSSSVIGGTVAGAMGGMIRGPVGIASGGIAGAVAGGASWAIGVSLNVPTVTYTPVITIHEIPPLPDGQSGNGCL